MIIQYFSDIHLEFGETPLAATDANVVIAAGDIGIRLAGVEWLLRTGKPTIYVAGNHEFYGGDLVHTRDEIAEATAGSNVHFLENQAVEVDGIRFLGATLWTDFMGGNAEFMHQANEQMNDYNVIRVRSMPLRPQDLFEANARSRTWLAQELARPFAGSTVVVTHHTPTLESWMYSERAFYRAAYCNDLQGFFDRFRIDLWVHGHVHAAFDYRVNGVRVVCNPRGYNGYQLVRGFDVSKTLSL